MECPVCKIKLSTELRYQFMGQNGKGIYVALYWLKCPYCKEFIIYLIESSKGYEVLGDRKELSSELVINPKL
jgi:hypothetical protein